MNEWMKLSMTDYSTLCAWCLVDARRWGSSFRWQSIPSLPHRVAHPCGLTTV